MRTRTYNQGANDAFAIIRAWLHRQLKAYPNHSDNRFIESQLAWMKSAKSRYNKRPGGLGK